MHPDPLEPDLVCSYSCSMHVCMHCVMVACGSCAYHADVWCAQRDSTGTMHKPVEHIPCTSLLAAGAFLLGICEPYSSPGQRCITAYCFTPCFRTWNSTTLVTTTCMQVCNIPSGRYQVCYHDRLVPLQPEAVSYYGHCGTEALGGRGHHAVLQRLCALPHSCCPCKRSHAVHRGHCQQPAWQPLRLSPRQLFLSVQAFVCLFVGPGYGHLSQRQDASLSCSPCQLLTSHLLAVLPFSFASMLTLETDVRCAWPVQVQLVQFCCSSHQCKLEEASVLRTVRDPFQVHQYVLERLYVCASRKSRLVIGGACMSKISLCTLVRNPAVTFS